LRSDPGRDCQSDFPADWHRDSQADSRRDLPGDLRENSRGDFDGVLRGKTSEATIAVVSHSLLLDLTYAKESTRI
jgi:hypothetical protein